MPSGTSLRRSDGPKELGETNFQNLICYCSVSQNVSTYCLLTQDIGLTISLLAYREMHFQKIICSVPLNGGLCP